MDKAITILFGPVFDLLNINAIDIIVFAFASILFFSGHEISALIFFSIGGLISIAGTVAYFSAKEKKRK